MFSCVSEQETLLDAPNLAAFVDWGVAGSPTQKPLRAVGPASSMTMVQGTSNEFLDRLGFCVAAPCRFDVCQERPLRAASNQWRQRHCSSALLAVHRPLRCDRGIRLNRAIPDTSAVCASWHDCAFVQSNQQAHSMPEHISPLRQRMIDDMKLRNMSPNTQKVYTSAVKNFSRHFGKSPDKLNIEDIREYRLRLMRRGLKTTSLYSKTS